jgi:hypothetical protein
MESLFTLMLSFEQSQKVFDWPSATLASIKSSMDAMDRGLLSGD